MIAFSIFGQRELEQEQLELSQSSTATTTRQPSDKQRKLESQATPKGELKLDTP